MNVACTVACTVPLAAALSIERTFVLVEEDVFMRVFASQKTLHCSGGQTEETTRGVVSGLTRT